MLPRHLLTCSVPGPDPPHLPLRLLMVLPSFPLHDASHKGELKEAPITISGGRLVGPACLSATSRAGNAHAYISLSKCKRTPMDEALGESSRRSAGA